MAIKRIYQLPPAIANQIAAGEVIERPASVVKELLENSLDAGADCINIEIDFGGLNQIKISDNGHGIVAEDLPLAIAANATSKISMLDDLYSITSMGFRGEALASISSIAHLTISSKTATAPHAMMLRIDTQNSELLPSARSQGTTVMVRDLFFNAPVRKKFLKTAAIEYQAIETVVKRFALAAPHIAIILSHNDKERLKLPAATTLPLQTLRVKKLLGKAFIEKATLIDAKLDDMSLQGWIGGASYQRSQNDKIWIYINKRMVKDKLLNHAVKQAYEAVLNPGRHPACLLYLTIPSNTVDVNVHPTKHEVRFQNPRLIHDFFRSNIEPLLGTASVSGALDPAVKPRDGDGEKRWSVAGQVIGDNPIGRKYSTSTTTGDMLILNKLFAVLFLNNQPFLVNLQKAQITQWTQAMLVATFPLGARPLLVPVRIDINDTQAKCLTHCQQLLMNVGIQCELISKNSIIMRSIPQCFPALDLTMFIQHIAQQPLFSDERELLAYVVSCQTFDAHILNQEERAELSAYITQQYATDNTMQNYGTLLDVVHCQSLLHE